VAEPAPAAAAGPAGSDPPRAEVWALLELFALCGLVVLQPLLDRIGRSPDFVIFHGLGLAEVVLLVLVFLVVPPAALWGIGVAAGRAGRRVRHAVHATTVGVLLALLAVQVGKQVSGVRGFALLGIALAVAAVALAGYLRLDAIRQLLRVAAVGPLLFVLLFAFASPASGVLRAVDVTAGAAAGRAVGPHPDVVLIIMDEFPLVSMLDGAGQVDAARFPNFAELAADSTWYRNATSVATWTPYAVPAMLTGRFPRPLVAPHYSQHPENLFTLLGEAYEIRASEIITQLCPPQRCGADAAARGGLPGALRDSAVLWSEIVAPVDPSRNPVAGFSESTVAEREGDGGGARAPDFLFGRAGENQPARFRDFLDRLAAPAATPTLDFLHLLLPHMPWTYLPSGMRYDGPALPLAPGWWTQVAHQRHLAQAQYADRLLGQTLRTLREADRYRDALVVVTADHGHSFTPGAVGRNIGPDQAGVVENAWVPLFIKAPGQTNGAVDDRNWQHVDLLPTIADHAGVAVPWAVDGISARGEARPGTDKIFYDAIGDRVWSEVLDGAAGLAAVRGEAGPVPPLPPPPRADLLGVPVVGAVAAGAVLDGPVAAEFTDAAAFADVAPESGVVPALVRGTLARPVPEGMLLAVAVNGRIGAVVPPIPGADGPAGFAALVLDETLFVAGANRVELHLVPTQEPAAPDTS
jgi:hypothetical protein